MQKVLEFEEALFDLRESVPRLFLSYEDFYPSELEETQWPMKNCRLEIDGDVFTITGSIPQYRLILGRGNGLSVPAEISEEEADKFSPDEIREGKRFWSGKPYKYLDNGWHKLKDRKDVRIEVRGQLAIIR